MGAGVVERGTATGRDGEGGGVESMTVGSRCVYVLLRGRASSVKLLGTSLTGGARAVEGGRAAWGARIPR